MQWIVFFMCVCLARPFKKVKSRSCPSLQAFRVDNSDSIPFRACSTSERHLNGRAEYSDCHSKVTIQIGDKWNEGTLGHRNSIGFQYSMLRHSALTIRPSARALQNTSPWRVGPIEWTSRANQGEQDRGQMELHTILSQGNNLILHFCFNVLFIYNARSDARRHFFIVASGETSTGRGRRLFALQIKLAHPTRPSNQPSWLGTSLQADLVLF